MTQATGTAERVAAEALMAEIPRSNRATLGGDKGYDTRAFVKAMHWVFALGMAVYNLVRIWNLTMVTV